VRYDHTAAFGIGVLGFLLGMRHATDPDHVIAVTTIVSRERRLAEIARLGLMWGTGHTITVLVVGGAIIVFKLTIPAQVATAMELAVAIVLVLLGLSAVRTLASSSFAWLGFAREPYPDEIIVHSHAHTHADAMHRHAHAHPRSGGDHAIELSPQHDHRLPLVGGSTTAPKHDRLKSLGVGLMHGLAGSASIGLLVLSAIPEPQLAIVYLVIFCFGTIIGMTLITAAIGAPLVLASTRATALHGRLVLGSGLVSFVFGAFLAWRIAMTDHLLTAASRWLGY
jgi:hypothetical protein